VREYWSEGRRDGNYRETLISFTSSGMRLMLSRRYPNRSLQAWAPLTTLVMLADVPVYECPWVVGMGWGRGGGMPGLCVGFHAPHNLYLVFAWKRRANLSIPWQCHSCTHTKAGVGYAPFAHLPYGTTTVDSSYELLQRCEDACCHRLVKDEALHTTRLKLPPVSESGYGEGDPRNAISIWWGVEEGIGKRKRSQNAEWGICTGRDSQPQPSNDGPVMLADVI
jgi:hypothetical protein